MILSHMRYNSPVDRSAEQGDSERGETRGKGGIGRLPVCNQSLRKTNLKTLVSLLAVANCFKSVKEPFCSAYKLYLTHHLLISTIVQQSPHILTSRLIYSQRFWSSVLQSLLNKTYFTQMLQSHETRLMMQLTLSDLHRDNASSFLCLLPSLPHARPQPCGE